MSEDNLNLDKVYNLAQSSHPIANHVRSSLEVIERALEDFGSVALSFNGGKDCTVLLHLFSAAQKRMKHKNVQDPLQNVRAPSLYIKTPNPFDEIESFVNSSARMFNLELYKAEGPMKLGLGQFLSNNPGIKAILIGTRRTDPHSGSLTSFVPTSSDWPEAMRVHPILDWDYGTVWAYLKELEVPYCSLYDHGFTSLGDKDNTLPNPLLENKAQEGGYDPAWKLIDGSSERLGRIKKN